MENEHPNAPAVRRRNPFKAGDRIAFPPMGKALACHSMAEDDGADQEPGGSCLDLTIGMQSLIHPDSFCEDVAAGFSDESSCAEDASVVPSHWNHDLMSPERPTSTTPLGIGLSVDGGCTGSTGGSCTMGTGSANMTSSPCMADLYMAMQGITEEASDAATDSMSGASKRRNGSKHSNASKSRWPGCGVDSQERTGESRLSNGSSDFAGGLEGISLAPSTLNQSSRIHLSQVGVAAGADESYGTPVREASSGLGSRAASCNTSEVGMLPDPAAPAVRTPSAKPTTKSALSPATPITPASCMKRPGRDGSCGREGLEGPAALVSASRVRFCDGFDDDKFSPIGAAHHTPNPGIAPASRMRQESVAVNLSQMLGSVDSVATQGCTDRMLRGVEKQRQFDILSDGDENTAELAAAESNCALEGGNSAAASNAHAHNSSTSSSGNSSHSSRRSLLSHPAFYSSPLVGRQPSPSCEASFNGEASGTEGKGCRSGMLLPEELERNRAGHGGRSSSGLQGRDSVGVLDSDNVVLEGEPAVVRFAAECQWCCRQNGAVLDGTVLLMPKYSASISLSLKADGTFALAAEVVSLCPDFDERTQLRHEVLSASSLYGSYRVNRCARKENICSMAVVVVLF